MKSKTFFAWLSIFRTIKAKVLLICVFFGILCIVATNTLVYSTVTELVENLIADRLVGDINYIESLIARNKQAHWHIKDDSLYYGSTLLGDGTEENAYFAPFLFHQSQTGTLSYVFMYDKNADLGYANLGRKGIDYQEGHYLRIAGSTKGPQGESIVGTYITKNVSDALDTHGRFAGEANVAGHMIYTLYHTLHNQEGQIVGAIVVGRYITELKAEIAAYAYRLSVMIFVAVSAACFFLYMMISKWLSAIPNITAYLKKLQTGDLQMEPLTLASQDEMAIIAKSINELVETMRENAHLRKKSETDALTGLPNRFAYENYSQNIIKYMPDHSPNLAVEILDIDYFKEFNDNYGHQAGDACIKAVAKAIQSVLVEYDHIFACRYGGDEFVLIYMGYSREEIETFLRRLRNRLLSSQIVHSYSRVSDRLTLSQGACLGNTSLGHTVMELLEEADKALYQVKEHGRNNFLVVEKG